MLAVAVQAGAQTLNSAYFTDGYMYRHTMNPAYGNEQNYVAIPAIGNIIISLKGNFGYQDVVFDNPMYGISSTKRLTTFMNPYISNSDALDGFSSGNNRIVGDVGVTILSAGFKAFGGYNTVELNSRTMFGISLPYELLEFAKNTGNSSYDIGDISAKALSFVELGFGHSRQINDRLRVGAKFKLLFGLGRADLKMTDVKADLTSTEQWTLTGQAEANVSLKGFEYKTSEETYEAEENVGRTYEQVDDFDMDGFGLGGFGISFDFGGEYKINDDWTVSASLLDVGFIRWNSNYVARSSGEPFVFDGFRDVSVTSDRGEAFDDKADSYGDQFSDFAHLEDQGDEGGRTTGIGATLNLAVKYNLPVYRPVSFGFLSSTRISGPYSWSEGRFSANYEPLKWLDGGINVSFNSFTTSFGWLVNFHPKGFNFFIGMDHLLGKQSKEGIPLSSNASLSLGMNITW